MKMNPKVKAAWVAALRSGEYQQARGQLRNRGSFCCLGVLCDLWDKDAWGDDLDPTAGLPPQAVDAWAHLQSTAQVVIHGESAPLHVHNDCGRTFAEIADAIEAQL